MTLARNRSGDRSALRGDILFEDISIDLDGPIDNICQYRESDPVRGHFAAFELGANIRSLTLRNIDITFHADKWPQSHLVTVGPKSAVREHDGKRVEVFDPYVDCTVGSIAVEGLAAHGAVPQELVRTISFDNVNGDGRSSGSGKVNNIVQEK